MYSTSPITPHSLTDLPTGRVLRTDSGVHDVDSDGVSLQPLQTRGCTGANTRSGTLTAKTGPCCYRGRAPRRLPTWNVPLRCRPGNLLQVFDYRRAIATPGFF